MRQILQRTRERTAQDLAVALRGLQQIALQARQLRVELPFGEADAIGRNAEAWTLTARQRADVVRARSGQEQPLGRGLIAHEPTAALSRFTERRGSHRAAAAIEASSNDSTASARSLPTSSSIAPSRSGRALGARGAALVAPLIAATSAAIALGAPVALGAAVAFRAAVALGARGRCRGRVRCRGHVRRCAPDRGRARARAAARPRRALRFPASISAGKTAGASDTVYDGRSSPPRSSPGRPRPRRRRRRRVPSALVAAAASVGAASAAPPKIGSSSSSSEANSSVACAASSARERSPSSGAGSAVFVVERDVRCVRRARRVGRRFFRCVYFRFTRVALRSQTFDARACDLPSPFRSSPDPIRAARTRRA